MCKIQRHGLKDRRYKKFRMGGRAVDCDGLENRCGGNSTGGSNPSPSAIKINTPQRGVLFYGSVGRMRTPVRQQVDLTSATQSNRHGCPAADA